MELSRNRPSIVTADGTKTLLASSILARLPLAMFSIALLVHVQRLTGSFAVAGAVCGTYAICSAAAAPQLGRVVDRCGQTRVLLVGSTITSMALVAAGLLPSGIPPAFLVALGGTAGLATPPLAACVRTLLPSVVIDRDQLPRLFVFESTVLELTFVAGPPLALGLDSLWSSGAALVVSGLLLLAGTLVFAAQPASRRWRPQSSQSRTGGGAFGAPAMRTLVLIVLATGCVFGATEVGVTSATHALGRTAAAGPLLGIWGVGSLLGGIVATRLGGGGRGAGGLILLVGTLAASHGALIVATGSVLSLGIVILLAGATIAPTVSSVYAMVDRLAPPGTHTAAFSWLVTASLSGAALGSAAGGALAQWGGARAVFALVGAGGALATLVTALRARTLEELTPTAHQMPIAHETASTSHRP